MTGDLKDMLERGEKLNKEEDIKKIEKIDFEQFLQERFVNEEPQVLDDDIPDAFNAWLENSDLQEIIDYADMYANKIYKERN